MENQKPNITNENKSELQVPINSPDLTNTLINTNVNTDTEKLVEEEPFIHNKSNAIQSEDFLIKGATVEESLAFSIPTYRYNKFKYTIGKFNNINIDNSKSLDKWKDIVQKSVDYYTTDEMYDKRTEDIDSSFEQGVKDSNGTLNTISNFKLKEIDGEIKGELALLKVAKFLSIGEIIKVPLPHSGMWVTIKPVNEKDLIDFYNNLYRDKITLGRATSGLTLSNFSVFVNNSLIDFILDHVHSISYSDIPIKDLKKYISIHDLPILAWGFASAIYPSGFDYNRACISDVEKCSYTSSGKINLTKLLWVDNSALTTVQKNIMAEFRPNKLTIDSYNKYKLEHVKTINTYFKTPNGIKINLRIPNLDEYTTDGLKWVNELNNKLEDISLKDNSEENRISTLEQYVKATSLCQYNHFIESIELNDNIMSDRDTINSVLELLSGDNDTRTNIVKNINEYISNTTIAIIGIPEYKCPECGANNNPDPINSNFVDIIPIDTLNLFFSLIIQKVSKILNREL